MANTAGRYYYLGKDGKEYFTREDADKYGSGAVKKRWHSPVKEYEDLYGELDKEEAPMTQATETDVVNVPEGIMEYDQLDVAQMKAVLLRKGIKPVGNQSRETLLAKLKSLQ